MNEEVMNEVKNKLNNNLKAVKKERIYNSLYVACALMFLCLIVFWADGSPAMSFIIIPIAGIVGWIAMFLLFSLMNKKRLCSDWCTGEYLIKNKYYISSVDNSIEDNKIKSIDCDRFNVFLNDDEYSCITSEDIFNDIEVGQKYLIVFSGKKVKTNTYFNRNYILYCSKI